MGKINLSVWNTILIEVHGSGSKFKGFHKDTTAAKEAAIKAAGKRYNVSFVIAKVQSDFNVIGGEIRR